MRDPDGYLIEVGQYTQASIDHFTEYIAKQFQAWSVPLQPGRAGLQACVHEPNKTTSAAEVTDLSGGRKMTTRITTAGQQRLCRNREFDSEVEQNARIAVEPAAQRRNRS